MNAWTSVAILAAYFVTWAVLHSFLASLTAKSWLRRRLGAGFDRWYRLAYSMFATLALLPLLPMLYLLPTRVLYVVPAPWRWIMLAGQLLALAGMAGALWQTGVLRLLGFTQLVAKQPAETGPLQVRGLFRYVRHPLYVSSMLFLWLFPFMTLNMLTLVILFSLYFYLGSIHEEHLLTSQFGDTYRRYRACVPRLVPRLAPRPGPCLPDDRRP